VSVATTAGEVRDVGRALRRLHPRMAGVAVARESR
jgi:hypothetical protein